MPEPPPSRTRSAAPTAAQHGAPVNPAPVATGAAAGPAARAPISVVIPTYRRESVLCDTLRRLLALVPPGGEIIVVDQTPEPAGAVAALVAEAAGRIAYLRLDAPNLPRARNVGWRAASAEIVVYLDDDVIVHDGLLEVHRAAFQAPTVGGVAGRVLTRGFPLPDRPAWKSHLPSIGWLFFNFAQTRPCEVWTARGCHMSFRRTVLDALGGFDERYLPWPASREETDLCFRLRRAGWRLVFEPRATVEHLMHETGGERVQHRDSALSPMHHANALYFVWKNVPAHQRPLLLLVLLIQELRRQPVGRGRRSWADRGRVLRLFLRGVVEGRRRARAAGPSRG